MKVEKIDGKIEKYSFSKIQRAVSKAFKSCDDKTDKFQAEQEKFIGQLAEKFTKVEEKYDSGESEGIITISDIENIILKLLIEKHKDCVKDAYLLKREEKRRKREMKSRLLAGVKEKLEAQNVQNQNANVDEKSFGGRTGEATGFITKQMALDYYMTEMARNNHLNNEIYIHDLDSYVTGMHNCLSIPFDDLLAKGFNTRQTDVRPANSINTAFQLVAVIFQLQSLQQFGGVSATHLDWTMVPYVKKSFLKHYMMAYFKDNIEFHNLNLLDMFFEEEDEKIELENGETLTIYRNKLDAWIDAHKDEFFERTNTKEEDYYLDNASLNLKYRQAALLDTLTETKQAVEGMYHNLNTLQSRSGNQLPFTSINYGTCTSTEGRIVIQCLLDVSLHGLGKNRKTSIFPCGIFQYMKGVNDRPGMPNYDLYRLALKSTSQRLYPNYANVDWSGNAGYNRNDPRTYFSTMGCRTANGLDINGLGQMKDGRGNICPVTIILPTLAMEAVEEAGSSIGDKMAIDKFFEILDRKINEARDMLIERFNWICKQPMESAKFMYENGTMAGYDGKNISSALKHGTLALGQLGLAECLQILIGCDHTTEEGMDLAKRVEQLFNTRCKEYKEEYRLNFGVYYTPAENLCKTALKKFRNKYGIIPNVSDKEFFTNSMHIPVWHDMDPFRKIDLESQLTSYSNAGCITYIELPASAKHNVDALETIVNYAMEHDIPYFAVNVPNDQCMDCGYIDEMGETCPNCGGSNIQRLRRVTGYLSSDYHYFNDGKIDEVERRVLHIKN